jgi:acyl-CoA thioester hydrolase
MREPRDERRADFPYRLAVSSRWQDCDAYGHVNNVVYYSWFDTAVATLLMQQRVIWLPDSPTIGLCVEGHCRFFAPIGLIQPFTRGAFAPLDEITKIYI